MKSLFIFHSPLVLVSLFVVLVVLCVALVGASIAPHDPLAINQNAVNQTSSADHFLGTDEFGRDILSRLLVGIRPTILVASISTVIAVVGGTLCGIVGAHSRPLLAIFAMRTVDTS